MDKKELIGLGDASVRKALANMFTILNKDGEILSRMGGDGADTMMFSPRLECDKDCSVVLFDDEDKARGAIEEILSPQEDGEYHIFRFTALDDDDDGCRAEDDFDFDADDDECVDYVECDIDLDDDDGEDGANGNENCGTFDSGEMSLDDAIERARESGSKMLSNDPDCDCGKEQLQIAKWLEELRSIRGMNGTDDNGCDDSDDCVEESASPLLKDVRRTLKRNGYQLVSQRGSQQHWKKDENDDPIILPCVEDTFDGTKWAEIVRSRGLTTDFGD